MTKGLYNGIRFNDLPYPALRFDVEDGRIERMVGQGKALGLDEVHQT
jgi:hypothetical protein